MTTPRTLVDFFRNLETLGKPDLLLHKKDGKWLPVSSAAFAADVKAVAAALGSLSVPDGGAVVLLSENRPEWPTIDFACQCQGAVLVPIFPTMVADQAEYIVRDCGATVAFASTPEQAAKLLKAQATCPKLKHVFVFDHAGGGGKPFAKLLEEGRRAHEASPATFDERAAARQPSDLATIIYTSGTTGEPKGAMLTQGNFVSNVLSGCTILPFDGSAVALSFLPLSHVFERLVEYCYYHRGATIAFAESIDKLRENLVEVNPHLFVSVPRVYEKVYARVMDRVEAGSPARKKLFASAIAVGKEVLALRAEKRTPGGALALQHFLYERLVFRKVREALGSRFRFAVSGGAPLSRDLAEFFWAIGVEIYEGYGLTETSPVISVNGPAAWRLGTVGRILPGVECRIAPDGEILTRGPHVMKGYHGKPEATAEAIDPEGWFHTGDIGIIDGDGFLKITDRKKEIIVNSNGKNIAPAPIENALKADPFVSQPVVIGDRRKFLSCLIVPNLEKLREWAGKNGLSGLPDEDLLKDTRVLQIYQGIVDRWNMGKPHEQVINAFKLLPAELTIEGGELTPTLKVKRRIVDQKYKSVIDELYKGD
ncbi:MAG: long-chain fatty acid--CoA ligase [Thermoanaerobaculia bacterium]